MRQDNIPLSNLRKSGKSIRNALRCSGGTPDVQRPSRKANEKQLQIGRPPQVKELHNAEDQHPSGSADISKLPEAGVRAKKAHENIKARLLRIITLVTEIKSADSSFDISEFETEVRQFEKRYHNLVRKSRTDANNICTFASKIGTIVIPMCTDSSVAKGDREKKLKKYMEKAEVHRGFAAELSEEFHSLMICCAELQGKVKFPGWSAKEKSIQSDIAAVEGKIKKIQEELKELNSQLFDWSLGLGASAALLGVTCYMIVSGPVTLAVVASGSIFFGICTLGCAWKVNKLYQEKKACKQNRLDPATKEKCKIQKSLQEHESLIKKLEDPCVTINKSLEVFENLWNNFEQDLSRLEQWLEEGAEELEDLRLPYMKCSVGEAAKIYKTLGCSLQAYVKELC
ncbi:hypothetical protein BDZ91DRAFT_786748 [Kalaharituber pfeilii]|nr:hypothetical protein BDZ91DRAFT_786748 [Kalaharituber pfeilii]